MDRSFLFKKEVIEASREFVCIRLATYENKEEADYLTQVFRGRSGMLENTVYAMLTPDGSDYITRRGRSPGFAFNDYQDMAKQMKRVAARYKSTGTVQTLPSLEDFRLSLNVAACDNMPLVVGVTDDPKEKKALTTALIEAAWSKELIGKYAYAPVSTPKALADAKLTVGKGIYVIEPDAYGQTGKVLAKIEASADPKTLEKELVAAVSKFKLPQKQAMQHIRNGNLLGINWKSLLPNTDPGPRGGRPSP